VIDRSRPALVHAWLGAMYQDGAHGLIGWIDLDPAVRPPRDNGSRDIEIVLETGALEHAPAGWAGYHAGQPGPPLVFLTPVSAARPGHRHAA